MTEAPVEVVILNDYASLTGGSTAVAIASALELARRGVAVTFFSCVGPVAAVLRGVPRLEVICLGQEEIVRNPNRRQAAIQGVRNQVANQALKNLLADKSRARTVVHVHTWTKALSAFPPATAARLGFPLVITLHDFFISCPTGGFFVHPTKNLCRRTPLSPSCLACNCDRRSYAHKLWRVARTIVQNGVLRLRRKAAFYIGVSEFSLKILRPNLPSRSRTRVVRHPVDCERGEPAPAAANQKFLFIGRFEVEKGAGLFAEAIQASGLPATFIGAGALEPELRQRCPESLFTGWIQPAAIRHHLRGTRALVFPPLWYETLGLVVVEAAAAGVPAIVSDQCAATDFIRDGINGLHFRRGSAESLAQQMQRIARESALTARLGRAAYDWYWRDPWTAERHVDELLGIYREILGQKGRRMEPVLSP